jgi:hypothetical protein
MPQLLEGVKDIAYGNNNEFLFSKPPSDVPKEYKKIAFAVDAPSLVKILEPIIYDINDYDPHLYYDKWEKQFKNNIDVNSSIFLITSALSAMGWNFLADTEEMQKVWDDFAKKFEFDQFMRIKATDTLRCGQAYAYITEDPFGQLPKYIQNFDPKRVYPIFRKNSRLVIGWAITKFGLEGVNIFSGKLANIIKVIKPSDLPFWMTFDINRFGESPYGIPLVAPAYDMIQRKKALIDMAYLMAYRATHGLLIASVDVTGLSEDIIQEGENKGESEQTLYMKAVANFLADRVRVDAEGNYILKNDLVYPDRITIDSIEIKNDLKGVSDIIDVINEEIYKQMKAPRIFQNIPEGTNRSTSQTIDTGFRTFLISLWKDMTAPLWKLTDALNITGKFWYEEINRELLNTLILSATRMTFMYKEGVYDLEEVREFNNNILRTNFNTKKEITPPAPMGKPDIQSPSRMRYVGDNNSTTALSDESNIPDVSLSEGEDGNG